MKTNKYLENDIMIFKSMDKSHNGNKNVRKNKTPTIRELLVKLDKKIDQIDARLTNVEHRLAIVEAFYCWAEKI